MNSEEKIAVSFGISFFICGLIAFFEYLFHLDSRFIINFTSIAALLVLFFCLGAKEKKQNFSVLPAGIFLLYVLKVFALTTLLPIYAGGGWAADWMGHYQIAQVFDHNFFNPEIIVSRTPLYNLVQNFYLNLLGFNFCNFQMINALLSSLFVLSAYLLGKKLFGEKIALAASALLLVNPWCLHQSWYTWPKMLAVYYILLSLYFYLKQDYRWSAFFGGLGYLTHPLALFYLAGLLVDYSYNNRRRFEWKPIAIFFALIIPWYSFLIYSFDLKRTVFLSLIFSYHPGLSPDWINFLVSRLHSAIFSILPFHLFSFIAGTFNRFSLDLFLFTLSDFYFNTLCGALALSGVLALLAGKPRIRLNILPAATLFLASLIVLLNFHSVTIYPPMLLKILLWTGFLLSAVLWAVSFLGGKKKIFFDSKHRTILTVIITSYLLSVFVHPGLDWHGIMHNAMPATAVIALIYFCELVRRSSFWLMAGLIIESAIGVWVYLWTLYTPLYWTDSNWSSKSELLLSDLVPVNWALPAALLIEAVCLITFVYFFKSKSEKTADL